MISEQIEEDARRLDEITAELNREAQNHKKERDAYHESARVLADKRDALQRKARSLSSEAAVYKERRDDAILTAKECRAKRDEWNDRVARMRASGGLGDIGEAKTQANQWHQKAEKASNSSDAAHEKMHQLYSEADRLREEAQRCHQQYLDCKKAADLEHAKYIEAVRKIERIRDNLPDRSHNFYLEASEDVEGLLAQPPVVRCDAVPADEHAGLRVRGACHDRIRQNADVRRHPAYLDGIERTELLQEAGASEGVLLQDPALPFAHYVADAAVEPPSLGAPDAMLDGEHHALAGPQIICTMGIHCDEHRIPGADVLLHPGAHRALDGSGGRAPQRAVHKIVLVVHDDERTHDITPWARRRSCPG